MFLDAGGVIVLPHRRLVCDALADVDITVQPATIGRAHYRAVRQLDRDWDNGRDPAGYLWMLCRALGVPADRLADATAALSQLADRGLSGEILWSEAPAHAQDTIRALQGAGIAVLVVTNSDGHAAENLRDAGVCQTTPGAGTIVTDLIDSELVGSAKPDPEIFSTALQRANLDPISVVHVGDMVSTDVVGARAAGLVPIHLDPYRLCRATDHRHVRSLAGIWRHVAPVPNGQSGADRAPAVDPTNAPSPARRIIAGCGSPMSQGAGPSRYDASQGWPARCSWLVGWRPLCRSSARPPARPDMLAPPCDWSQRA